MRSTPSATVPPDLVRTLAEQIVFTGVGITELLEILLEHLPPDAFPGEAAGEVLLDMLAGTIGPVAVAAGPVVVDAAISLLSAAVDRAGADLRQAAVLAAARVQRPC